LEAALVTFFFVLETAALTAAVEDLVASRGERRVAAPVDAFLAGMEDAQFRQLWK